MKDIREIADTIVSGCKGESYEQKVPGIHTGELRKGIIR